MQRMHWNATLSERPDMFGAEPSEPALDAAALFARMGRKTVLELGGGQGRDTLFFAKRGFHVTVLDYAQAAVDAIVAKAKARRLEERIRALCYDVRRPLPFEEAAFECCYSHMLFCMGLTLVELDRLSAEVLRVLRPGGLHVYTARHTGDPHCRTGIQRGEDMYEVGGFIVHLFDRAKVRRLAAGYDVLDIHEFEEGILPRKLFRVTLRKVTGVITENTW